MARAMFPFVCDRCETVQTAGSTIGGHKGHYLCAACMPGGDE